MTAGFSVIKGEPCPIPDDPGKEGATFGGWYLDKQFKVRYSVERAFDEDINLYAKFTYPNPSIASFSNTEGGLKITWKGSGDALYRVFRKGPKDKNWVKMADVDGLSYVDSKVVSGTAYTYTIRRVNSYGKTYQSGYNATGWKTTYYTMPEIATLTPAANGMGMAWNKSAGVYGYKVFRKDGNKWKAVGTTKLNAFVDTSVISGLDYTYTVRAVDKAGKYVTDFDNIGMTATFVAAPRISKIENTTAGAKLTWGKCGGAKKYRIFVKSGLLWKKLADTSSTSYVHTKAVSGTTYTYTVRALDISGSYCSAFLTDGWKNQYIATPALPTLKNTKNGVKITSVMPKGAVKYCIFRKEYGSSKWQRIATNIAAGTKTFVDKTAKNGKKYSYTIRCLSKDGKKYTSDYNRTGKTITCKR